jgi:type IV pilus assembly protein PilW
MVPPAHSSRGFSLIELVIALTISLIVIAGATALLMSTQRTFETTSNDRYLQETARIALGHISSNLRNAGFGVDPALAFDFGKMNNVRMDRAPSNATFSTPSTFGTGLNFDSTTQPDHIVFFSRDPAFGPHPLLSAASASSSSLTIAGPLNVDLLKGQILLVACYTGNMTWAYVQVSSGVKATSTPTVTIPIVTGAGTTFPQQNAWMADSCFSSIASLLNNVPTPDSLSTATEVFKVDRYHYSVVTYDASGNLVAWGTAGARPYLMLEQGLTDATGQAVNTVVSPDVEDLQLSYIFPLDPVTPLVGAAAGTAISNDDQGINLAPANGCPVYSDPMTPVTALTRLNHHPGNIGAVRVSLVLRTADADVTYNNSSAIPAAGNRGQIVGPPGYLRLLVDTTVGVPNLSALTPYFPTYSGTVAAGSRQLNVGGG